MALRIFLLLSIGSVVLGSGGMASPKQMGAGEAIVNMIEEVLHSEHVSSVKVDVDSVMIEDLVLPLGDSVRKFMAIVTVQVFYNKGESVTMPLVIDPDTLSKYGICDTLYVKGNHK